MSNFFLAQAWPRAQKSRSIFQRIPYRRIGIFTAFCDFALVVAASPCGELLYHYTVDRAPGDVPTSLAIGTYSGLIFVLLSRLLGLYQPNALLSASTQVRGVAFAWAGVLLTVTSFFFLLKNGEHFSRGGTISFGILGVAILLASRALTGLNLKRALANGTLAGQRSIVIGEAAELAGQPALHLLRTYGMREVGRFELPGTDDCAAKLPGEAAHGITHDDDILRKDLAIVDAGIKAAQAARAEQILLALPWSDTERRSLICKHLRALPLPVLLLPDRSVSSLFSDTDRCECALNAVEVQRAPLSRHDLLMKRSVDLMLACVGLLILSPLLLLTGIAIKLDSPGPIIFRQRRRGFSGREFCIYKFRTMTVLEDGTCIRQAQRYDRRVTTFGRLLRASSIDELPQLINVVRGEMSVVGPRPHAVAHDDEYSLSVDNYAFRRHVKPGLTGWAQIHGSRGETADIAAMDKRIRLDLWYINNWNFWLDIRILAQTCLELLRPRNAY
jgi:undecaprenyl-phosphate galactose phosphotransferase/putative colanic acid biosynthesis UDP-glucose lipid carrier transferase